MKKNYFFNLVFSLVLYALFFDTLVAQQDKILLNLPLSTDTIKALIIKENLLVNTLEGEPGAMQSNVQVAMSGIGTYAFCWFDFRNNKKEIYFQIYDRSGNKISVNTKVEIFETISDNPPFITANKNGLFIIGWICENGNVAAQKFNSYAEPLGRTIYLGNYLGEISNLWMTFNSDQTILATWNEKDGASSNRIKYVYTSIGYVDNNDGYNIQSIKNTSAIDENNNALVTWYGYKNDSSFIYLQRFLNGYPVWDNMILHSAKGSYSLTNPQISYIKEGIYIVVWNETDSTQHNFIKYRLVNSVGFPISDVRVCAMNNYSISLKTVINNKNDKFYISFVTGTETYMVEVSSEGILLTSPVVLTNDAPFPIINTELSDIFDDNIIVASDYIISTNNYSKNVGYYTISTDFNEQGKLIKINDDICNANQKKSVVNYNSTGEALVIWQDERTGKLELFAQVYDQYLNPVGDNIQITDSLNNFFAYDNVVINSYSDGTFLVGFIGYVNYNYDKIIFQQISNRGQLILNNLIVDPIPSNLDNKICVQVNSLDESLICWYNKEKVTYSIFNKFLELKKGPKIIKHSENDLEFNPITVSVDTSFKIFVSWRNYYYNNNYFENDLYGEFYNRKGEIIKERFVIDKILSYGSLLSGYNTEYDFVLIFENNIGRLNILRSYDNNEIRYINSLPYATYDPSSFKIKKFENQKVLLTYSHSSNLFGTYFDDTKRQNVLFLFSNPNNPNFYNSEADYGISFNQNKVLISSEYGSSFNTGLDIFISELRINGLDFFQSYFFQPEHSDYLHNNYPNPFNPVTTIVYELLSYHSVRLSIYNILGQEVKVLVDEDQEKGLYEVNFDGTGLASGIYFYRLDAFNTSIKKMIYLK